MRSDNVIFHADDFGANPEISEHILDCCRDGSLGSLSFLPNSPYLDPCMEMLAPYRGSIRVSVHLNLAEGPCLSDPADVPWLVDGRGMFAVSFFRILMLSAAGKRAELKRQIKTELSAQLARALPYVDTLRLDSHQHYHMIPVVLESVLEAVAELPETAAGRRWLAASPGRRAEIEFIRIPAEPVSPFLRRPRLYRTYRPINFVKQIVLNTLNLADRKRLAPYRDKSAVFFGILLSGGMDIARVSALLPEFWRIAQGRGLPLETLCHPGGVGDTADLMDPGNRDCVAFYTSEGRKREKEMLLEMGKRLGKKNGTGL